jgi:hypothetical protein
VTARCFNCGELVACVVLTRHFKLFAFMQKMLSFPTYLKSTTPRRRSSEDTAAIGLVIAEVNVQIHGPAVLPFGIEATVPVG